MSPEAQNLLYLIAEIAIGTVALSGITMVLLVSEKRVSEDQTGQISAQLAMAFAVVIFSIFPLLINIFDLTNEKLWRASSGAYLGLILMFQAARLINAIPFPNPSGISGLIVSIPAITALVLLSLNFWLATSWPYLVQLFIALATSMILYLRFVFTALSKANSNTDT